MAPSTDTCNNTSIHTVHSHILQIQLCVWRRLEHCFNLQSKEETALNSLCGLPYGLDLSSTLPIKRWLGGGTKSLTARQQDPNLALFTPNPPPAPQKTHLHQPPWKSLRATVLCNSQAQLLDVKKSHNQCRFGHIISIAYLKTWTRTR